MLSPLLFAALWCGLSLRTDNPHSFTHMCCALLRLHFLQVLTEGFDEPAIDAILMARPTRSTGLYTQVGQHQQGGTHQQLAAAGLM